MKSHSTLSKLKGFFSRRKEQKSVLDKLSPKSREAVERIQLIKGLEQWMGEQRENHISEQLNKLDDYDKEVNELANELDHYSTAHIFWLRDNDGNELKKKLVNIYKELDGGRKNYVETLKLIKSTNSGNVPFSEKKRMVDVMEKLGIVYDIPALAAAQIYGIAHAYEETLKRSADSLPKSMDELVEAAGSNDFAKLLETIALADKIKDWRRLVELKPQIDELTRYLDLMNNGNNREITVNAAEEYLINKNATKLVHALAGGVLNQKLVYDGSDPLMPAYCKVLNQFRKLQVNNQKLELMVNDEGFAEEVASFVPTAVTATPRWYEKAFSEICKKYQEYRARSEE